MLRSIFGRHALLVFLISGTVFFSGCERKDINQIKAEPSRYLTKEVAIAGNVVQSFSVLGRGAYEVDDGTGRLWVLSETGVPRKGARVVVKGTVRDALNVGSVFKLPDAVTSGLVMIEKSHRAQ